MKIKFFKVIACILCLCSLVAMFAACDGGENNGDDSIFAVKYKGTTIKLGAKPEATVEALGEPKSKKPAGLCGELGESFRYDYGSVIFEVVEYKDKAAEIDKIYVQSDAAETSKGIYIGCSRSEVEEAYGEPDSAVQSSVTYKDGDKLLTFGFTDGKVDSIILSIGELQ